MMIERQEFATEHIHVVKPLRISLPGISLLALSGEQVKIVHETALGIC